MRPYKVDTCNITLIALNLLRWRELWELTIYIFYCFKTTNIQFIWIYFFIIFLLSSIHVFSLLFVLFTEIIAIRFIQICLLQFRVCQTIGLDSEDKFDAVFGCLFNCTNDYTIDSRGDVGLSLIHIWRCRRYSLCRSRWSPYH